jgi:hypothetical protein
MKFLFLSLLFVFCFLPGFGQNKSQCEKNPDPSYSREGVSNRLVNAYNALKKERGVEFLDFKSQRGGYPDLFIWDLTDVSNRSFGSGDCVDFIEGHVYHFAAREMFFSLSMAAVLEGGTVSIYGPLNCGEAANDFERLLLRLNGKVGRNDPARETLTRVKNYRRFGHYFRADFETPSCLKERTPPKNSDPLYSRTAIIERLSNHLRSLTEKYRYFPQMVDEGDWAIGFFVHDLTNPENKQTGLTESVEFKDRHVYHFAYIDLPFSYSNIAYLENGQIKIFKSLNCPGRGDRVSDAIAYLDSKLKPGANKRAVLARVKDYRKYGVYSSFDGSASVRCSNLK